MELAEESKRGRDSVLASLNTLSRLVCGITGVTKAPGSFSSSLRIRSASSAETWSCPLESIASIESEVAVSKVAVSIPTMSSMPASSS
jgi:hypothetical protein